MWMKGSSARWLTPAKARRTGNPSPSKPFGAVVTASTRRGVASGAACGTRGSVSGFSTVTAGMTGPSGGRADSLTMNYLRSTHQCSRLFPVSCALLTQPLGSPTRAAHPTARLTQPPGSPTRPADPEGHQEPDRGDQAGEQVGALERFRD